MGSLFRCQGHSSGLALLWLRETNLEIKSFGSHHIDAVVTDGSSNFRWRLTSFYGHPQTRMRQQSWDLLADLKNQFQLPWFCFGDFNEILSSEKKLGRATRCQSQMDKFRDVVNLYGFKDLGYSRTDYTLCNMQSGDSIVYLRLNRAFATSDWVDKFGEVRVNHLVDSTSNHCALYIAEPRAPQQPRARRFHFEAMWAKCESCKDVIEAA